MNEFPSFADLIREYCEPNPKDKSKFTCPICNNSNLSVSKSGKWSCLNEQSKEHNQQICGWLNGRYRDENGIAAPNPNPNASHSSGKRVKRQTQRDRERELEVEVMRGFNSVEMKVEELAAAFCPEAGVTEAKLMAEIAEWAKVSKHDAYASKMLLKERLQQEPGSSAKKSKSRDGFSGKKEAKQSQISKKLAGKYRNKFAFSAEHDVWFEYEAELPGAWSQVKDSEIKMALQQDLDEMEELEDGFSASYRNGVYDLFMHHPDIYFKKWDAANGLIPFANGVYSMVDRTFTPGHSPRNYLTYSLPRNYEETEGYDEIEKWLNFVFDGNQQQIRLFSYMSAAILRRMWYLQKFLHLQGKPGGGKSVAQRLLSELIGKQNTVNTSLEALAENKFETSRLVGKPLALLPDQDDYRGSIGTFLQITGNDAVRSERKNRDAVQFQFQGICCISSNGPAFVSRTGGELTRRQILLMFTKSVDKPDPRFLEKLLVDLPGWTNYLLSIPESELLSVLKPENGGRLTRDQWEFRKRVDSIAAWLDECVLVADSDYTAKDYSAKVGNNRTDTSTLFGSYQEHCRNSDGMPKGLREFSELVTTCLESLFPDRKFLKKRDSDGWKIKGIKLRGTSALSRLDPTDRKTYTPTYMVFPEAMNEMNNDEQGVYSQNEQSNADEIRIVNSVNNDLIADLDESNKESHKASQIAESGSVKQQIVHTVHSNSENSSAQRVESNGHCSQALFTTSDNCSFSEQSISPVEEVVQNPEWVQVGARCRYTVAVGVDEMGEWNVVKVKTKGGFVALQQDDRTSGWVNVSLLSSLD